MKISKNIKVEEGIRLNYFNKRRLVNKNICKQKVYLICTSPCKHWLFEIIPSTELSIRYNESYLVGITKTRNNAVLQVADIIDEIYNKQNLVYEEFIT